MVYKGRVKDGVIVLDKAAALPDGLVVDVFVPDAQDDGSTLFERLQGVVGIAEGLPSDLARNHDQHIHRRIKP
jgi:hypothetical protein